MKIVFLVGLGGFIGSLSRYFIEKSLYAIIQSSFPYPTFLINLIGCFLIGLLFGLSNKLDIISFELRIFLATGILGSFTTFSTFSKDSLILLKDGNIKYFLLYTLSSFIIGILFTFIGYTIVK